MKASIALLCIALITSPAMGEPLTDKPWTWDLEFGRKPETVTKA